MSQKIPERRAKRRLEFSFGQDLARALSEARLASAIAIFVFIGFGIASAVLLGMIYGQPWLTVLVIVGAAALAV